ncbi:MAG: hypothetical protein QNK37_19345 [Acidobacteriota bacterium]|nr:hypothetical protein [Acidobacteriota bacterium]
MARKLTFVLDDEPLEFALFKVDRDKLYGRKQPRAVDHREHGLIKGYLDEWGSVVIDQTGMGYLDESMEWRTRDELVAVNADGESLETHPSTFDRPVVLKDRADVDTFCDFEITTVYMLQGFHAEALAEKLAAVDGFYSFPFNYRAGTDPKTAFLNPVDNQLFMMIGAPTNIEFLDKPQIVALDAEDESGDEDEDDDLDFSMM